MAILVRTQVVIVIPDVNSNLKVFKDEVIQALVTVAASVRPSFIARNHVGFSIGTLAPTECNQEDTVQIWNLGLLY